MSDSLNLNSLMNISTLDLQAKIDSNGSVTFEVMGPNGWTSYSSGQTIEFGGDLLGVEANVWVNGVARKIEVLANGTARSPLVGSSTYPLGTYLFTAGELSFTLTVIVDGKQFVLDVAATTTTDTRDDDDDIGDIVIPEDPPDTGTNPLGLDWLLSTVEQLERQLGILVLNALGPRKDPPAEQFRFLMDLRSSGIRTLKSRLKGYEPMDTGEPEQTGSIEEPGRRRLLGRHRNPGA